MNKASPEKVAYWTKAALGLVGGTMAYNVVEV